MRNRLLGPLARRFGWMATALRVLDRFDEVHGNYLASAITLAAFVSLFPLLLVGVAVLGVVSVHQGASLPTEIIERFGLGGEAAAAVVAAIETARQSKRVAGPIGVVGLMWSGLGLVAAMQYAFDEVWQVTGRGLKDKAGGLLWLIGAVALFIASLATTAVLNYVPVLAPVSLLVGVAVNVALFLWTLRALTNVDVGWRAHLPGAVLGGVGLEVLKLIGTVYVPRAVASSSGLYGSIGVVFAVLAWLFLFGRLAVYATVLDVVRWEEDHGTVTVEIQLPKHDGEVPLVATRAGEARTAVLAS